MPLCPGLAPSHHRRWSVRVMAPGAGEPQGWYAEFVQRWRAFLEVLAQPRGSQPMVEVSAEQVARVRPREEGSYSHGVVEDAEAGGSIVRGRQDIAGDGTMQAAKRRRTAPPKPAAQKRKWGCGVVHRSTSPPARRRRTEGVVQAAPAAEEVVEPGQTCRGRKGRSHGRAKQGPPT